MTEKRKRDDGDGAAASKKPKRDKSEYSKNVDPSKSKAERKADRKVAKAARKAQNELKVENKAAVNVNGTDAPIEDSAMREATDSSADIEAPAASTVEEPKKKKKSKKDKSKPKKAGEDGAAFAIDTKGDASIAADAGMVMNGMTEAITPVEVKKEKKSKKRKAEAEEAKPESVVEKPVKKEKSSKHKGEAKATDSDSALPYTEHPALAKLPQSEITEFLESNQITTKDAETERRPIISFDYLPSLDGSANPFEGFKAPTPIQATTWPYLLAGQDVIGVAETGSGKTLAFGVPCVHRLLREKSKHIRACIVSPTRELALQIQEQLAKLSSSYGLKVTCVYGGVDKDTQRRALAGTSIVVATPGRLNDFVQEGSIDLSHVDYLVLDEADRMLDKGFEDDIRKIASSTAQTGRQTLMFTATWPESIRNLAATFMIKPVRILIGNATGELRANTRIVQEVEVVEPREKQNRLFQLLKQYQSGKNKNDRILVFCLYKKEATRIEEFIRYKGFNVAGIHGDLGQLKRQESLEAFKNGSVPLLVATDVAARGLDIPAVKLVINVTFPLTAEDYVHRIGRTGRAGQDGRAITMFTEEDKALSGALINVLKAAGQPVPEELMKFGTTVKKKSHDAYGAFYKDPADMKKATKITFD